MKRAIFAIVCVAALTSVVGAAFAARAGFGNLYYEDRIVRTVVPPAATPKEGRDDLFAVVDGAAGQLAVIAVAPGDRNYHGGQWAFHRVVWNTTPYLLTSANAVHAAHRAGDVSVERVSDNDFKCPVQK